MVQSLRVSFPGLEAKPWSRIDAGPDPFDLEQRVLSDPARLLGLLSSVSGEVRETGREDVRGVSTIRYEGTVDFDRVVEQAPPADRDGLRFELGLLREVGFDHAVPFALWVDGEGLARGVRLAPKRSTTTVVEFYDFGVNVDVSPPPTDQVATDEELFEAARAAHKGSSCDEKTEEVQSSESSTFWLSICLVGQDTGVSEDSNSGRSP